MSRRFSCFEPHSFVIIFPHFCAKAVDQLVDFLRWQDAQEPADGLAAETAFSFFLFPITPRGNVQLFRHALLRIGVLDTVFIDFFADKKIEVLIGFFHLYPFLSNKFYLSLRA